MPPADNRKARPANPGQKKPLKRLDKQQAAEPEPRFSESDFPPLDPEAFRRKPADLEDRLSRNQQPAAPKKKKQKKPKEKKPPKWSITRLELNLIHVAERVKAAVKNPKKLAAPAIRRTGNFRDRLMMLKAAKETGNTVFRAKKDSKIRKAKKLLLEQMEAKEVPEKQPPETPDMDEQPEQLEACDEPEDQTHPAAVDAGIRADAGHLTEEDRKAVEFNNSPAMRANYSSNIAIRE